MSWFSHIPGSQKYSLTGQNKNKSKKKQTQQSENFSGRKVTVADQKTSIPWHTVRKQLSASHGKQTQQKVMKDLKPSNLSLRKVTELHQQAEKITARTTQKNQKKLSRWLCFTHTDSPVSKAFSHLYSSVALSKLPALEKQRMTDFLTEKIGNKPSSLNKAEVTESCVKNLVGYRSCFSKLAPETAAALKTQLSCHGPVFSGQLTDFMEIRGDFNPIQQHWANKFKAATSLTASLTQDSPFEKRAKLSFTQQKTQIIKQKRRLSEMATTLNKNQLTLPANLHKAMISDIKVQIKQMDEHLIFINECIKNDFSSTENFTTQKQRQINTAINLLDQAIADTIKNREQAVPKKQDELTLLLNEYGQLKRKLKQLSPNTNTKTSPPHDISLSLREHRHDIMETLKASGMPSAYIKKNWASVEVKLVNREGWKTISKPLILRDAGQQLKCESHIKPAANMRFHAEETEMQDAGARDPFENSYKGGACSSPTKTRTDHALNLHQSSLRMSGQPKALYAGIRSGTMAAQKLKDPEERAKASDNWAKEIVTSALVHKLEQSPSLYSHIKTGEPIAINLGSTSLLTPDLLRSKTHFSDNERLLQSEQYNALHRLANSNDPLVVYDAEGNQHEIKIALDVAAMNVGVNTLSLNNMIEGVTQSRSKADEYMQTGLEKLMGSLDSSQPLKGWAGQWLAENPDSPDAATIKQLCHQIRHIYNAKLHHHEGQDAYKLVVRIQLLLHSINAVPHFNCKSGKDRTGEADARIKEFAFEVSRAGGTVPEPESSWTMERKEQVQAFLYGAGEQEVLMNNVGDAKLKTATGKQQQGELFSLLHEKVAM